MSAIESWGQVGTLAAAVTAAGPMISPSAAQASVTRLHRASEWALPLLADASGLPGAADRVAAQETLVVNRNGLITAFAHALEPLPTPSLPVGAAVAAGMHSLAGSVQAFCMPHDEHAAQILLVAPNVWETASRLHLDQADYAQWIALRSGLWAVCFTQAPWLPRYLRRLVARSPRGIWELAQVSVLLSQIISAQLEFLTPLQIPSIGWIRGHLPRSAMIQAVGKFRWLGESVPDLDSLESRAHEFVHALHLHEDPEALTMLLRSADHLPTAEELDTPRLWDNRVGLG